jgi:hypothetical protein
MPLSSLRSRPPSVLYLSALLGACVLSGWLFYGVGLGAFLEAAYRGHSLEYFNEFAARWRARHSPPSLQAFLTDARSLFFRLGVLGTAASAVVVGGLLRFPDQVATFFDADTSPYNLALFRILLFGTLLLFDLDTPGAYAGLPSSLQFAPPGLGPILPFVPTGETATAVGALLFRAACVSGLLGFYSRTSAAVAALAGTYVLGIPQLYGKTIHYHHVIWFAGLLAVSPAGDVLSLDAVRRAWRAPSDDLPEQAAAYARPLRFAWLLLGLIYFFPGFWKFANEGLGWALSSNLKYRMHTLWFSAEQFRPLFRLDLYPFLYQGAALATMVFEFGVLFTLPFATLRPWAAGAALVFHQSTHWFLNIYFWSLPPFLLSLLDLRSAAVTGGQWLSSPLHIGYDRQEAWQRRLVAVLDRFDLFDRLRFGPSPDADASLPVTASSGPALWVDGRPHGRGLLRLVRRAPAAIPLLPLAWGLSGSGLAAPSSDLPPPRARGNGAHMRSRGPVMLVGGILLGVNVICGLGHVHSWPFSVYPTFAVRSDSLTTTIQISAVDSSGRPVDVLSAGEEASALGLSAPRVRGLTRSLLLVSDPRERTARLKALWRVWRKRTRSLGRVKTVRFYRVTYPVSPPFRPKRPLSTTQIAEISV